MMLIAILLGLGVEAGIAATSTWSLPALFVAAGLTGIGVVFSSMTIAISDDRVE